MSPPNDLNLIVVRPELDLDISNFRTDKNVKLFHLPLTEYSSINIDSKKILDIDFKWVIFTSKRGVYEAKRLNLDISKKLIGAVGEKTAEAFCKFFGRNPNLVPSIHTAQNMCEKLNKLAIPTEKILWIRGQDARDTIPNFFNEDRLIQVIAYDTKFRPITSEVEDAFAKISPEQSVFFVGSPKSAKILATEFLRKLSKFKNCKFYAIGPVTAQALQSYQIDCKYDPNTTDFIAVIQGFLDSLKLIPINDKIR